MAGLFMKIWKNHTSALLSIAPEYNAVLKLYKYERIGIGYDDLNGAGVIFTSLR